MEPKYDRVAELVTTWDILYEFSLHAFKGQEFSYKGFAPLVVVINPLAAVRILPHGHLVPASSLVDGAYCYRVPAVLVPWVVFLEVDIDVYVVYRLICLSVMLRHVLMNQEALPN